MSRDSDNGGSTSVGASEVLNGILGLRSLPRTHLVDWAGLAAVAVLWVVLAPVLGPLKLPGPFLVVRTFVETWGQATVITAQGGGAGGLPPHVLATVMRTVVGAAVGIALGIAIGLVMAWSRVINDILAPFAEAARICPTLVVVPFFTLWFGTNPIAMIGVIVYHTTVTLRVVTHNAITNVAPVHQQFAMTLGASRGQVFRSVILPAIVPEVLGGVRVVMAAAWGLIVVAELIGAQRGVGFAMHLSQQYYAMEVIVVLILYVAAIGFVVDRIILSIVNRATRWMPEEY